MIDPDSKAFLVKELSSAVNDQINGLVTGSFPDLASLERHRGVIAGLGLALDIVEGKKSPNPTETQSGEETDDSTSQG